MLYTAVLYRLGVFKVGYMIRFGVKHILFTENMLFSNPVVVEESISSVCVGNVRICTILRYHDS